MHRYLLGLVADGIEVLPLAASKVRQQVREAGYSRTLRIRRREANGKVESNEGAPGLSGFPPKPPNERRRIGDLLESEGCAVAARENRLGVPSLLGFAAPVGVIDHLWLDGLCHARLLQSPVLSEGGECSFG